MEPPRRPGRVSPSAASIPAIIDREHIGFAAPTCRSAGAAAVRPPSFGRVIMERSEAAMPSGDLSPVEAIEAVA
jgi:hypothetical protein